MNGDVDGWGTTMGDRWEKADEARKSRSRRLVRRSTLIVPANVERFVSKAHLRRADAIMLDLEDSIPDDQKENAREAAAEAITGVRQGGSDLLVRINKPFHVAVRDLDAVVREGLTGVWFPKVETRGEVVVLDAMLTERELRADLPLGSVQIAVSIETPRGFANVREIACSSERIVTMGFGSEDVTLELEVEPTRHGKERFLGNATIVMLATYAGVQPHGRLGNVADYTDLDSWRDSIREAYAFGLKGSSCIHPAQVEALNQEFSPSAEQIAHAREVISALRVAGAEGRGSASVDGRMVDVPTQKRARQLLERAAAISAWEESRG